MFCLSGASALSTFRQEQLLTQLRSATPNLASVTARYIYFVDAEAIQAGDG